MVPYLAAMFIFVALSTVCWFVSIALYRNTISGPDPIKSPHHKSTAALAIGVASLTSFIQFPAGYFAGLVAWAAAAFIGLGLPTGRAALMFAYLAVSSFVARLVVLGFMTLFEI